MLANLTRFTIGLIALVAGARPLVRGASKLALSFGTSPLVIGLTIVTLLVSGLRTQPARG